MSEKSHNARFYEATASMRADLTSAEHRIHLLAVDERLVEAVADELSAEKDLHFPSLNELLEEGRKRHSASLEHVLEVAIQLQFEYGLSEDDALEAIYIARLDLETNGTAPDDYTS